MGNRARRQRLQNERAQLRRDAKRAEMLKTAWTCEYCGLVWPKEIASCGCPANVEKAMHTTQEGPGGSEAETSVISPSGPLGQRR